MFVANQHLAVKSSWCSPIAPEQLVPRLTERIRDRGGRLEPGDGDSVAAKFGSRAAFVVGGMMLARGMLPYRVALQVGPDAEGSRVAVSIVDEVPGAVRTQGLQRECQRVFDDLVGALRSAG